MSDSDTLDQVEAFLNKEIYNIADTDNICHPRDTVIFKAGHYRPANIHDFCGDGPQVGDRVADYYYLFPPVIFNFRDDAKEDDNICTRNKLSKAELNYFKNNGNNATIFIHGFNVGYGSFANQISNIVKLATPEPVGSPWSTAGYGFQTNSLPEYAVTMTCSARTIFCDPEVLQQQFSVLAPVPDYETWREMQENPSKRKEYSHLPEELWQDQIINGQDAHNWFVHMEDNLNYATGQFTRNAGLPPIASGDHTKNPYYKYTRLINVAWSGDLEPLDYMKAVENAKAAAIKLVPVVVQLIQAGIKVNIMAHSLGNVVLMTCLERLAVQGYQEQIAHAFLWDATLPDNVFASPADKKNNPLYHFPNAYKAAEKFTVLYSFHDNILGPLPPRQELRAKYEDPTGGFFIMVCEALSLIDKFNLPNHLKSVYNAANMLDKSWSFYLDPDQGEKNRNEFYTTWVINHPMNTQGKMFFPELNLGMADMFKTYPGYYLALATAIDATDHKGWHESLDRLLLRVEGSLVHLPVDQILNLTKYQILLSDKTVTQVYLKGFMDLCNGLGDKLWVNTLSRMSTTISERNTSYEEWDNPTTGPIPDAGSQEAQELATIILTILISYGAEPRPAIGYSGPDIINDTNTKQLFNSGKLIRADQQDYLKTHSGMKIPSEDMMKHVYQRWIINKDKPEVGIHPFGRYR